MLAVLYRSSWPQNVLPVWPLLSDSKAPPPSSFGSSRYHVGPRTPSVGSARSGRSIPVPLQLTVRGLDASILAVATVIVVPASSRLTLPSARKGAASAVDGVPSLSHVKRRGHFEGGRGPHTRAAPHGDFVRGCWAAMKQATSK